MKKNIMALKTTLLSLSMAMIFGLSAFAASANFAPDVPAVSEVFRNENGTNEIVIEVREDGSFVTASLEIVRAIDPNTCQHPATEIYGNPTAEPKSYNKQSSTNCYKVRTVSNARCVNCGKTGFRVYGSWDDRPHQYKLFGNTCTKCSYKK